MRLNPAIRTILNKRGISTAEEAVEFITDKPQTLFDPFLMPDMAEAADEILSAIEDGLSICIYGDYDADGVTATSLMMDVLKTLGANCSYYIPSRFDDGYGLNIPAIDKIKAAGADMIITVDCGCTSAKEVRHALDIGLEIIVTDHHAMSDEIPECLLIDPQRSDSRYPFKYLAGVGVAFKLAQALCSEAGLQKRVLTRNLDLVCIGTIGDIVPLVSENRTLTKYGLRVINSPVRPGLSALIDATGLKRGGITSENISYVITPHINAVGRMSNATLAARLMQTNDPERAAGLVAEMREANALRQKTQNEIMDVCEQKLAEAGGPGDYIMIPLENAHEGVIGIVAGKLKEKYYMPSIVLTDIGDGLYKGTGRSIDSVNILKALTVRRDIFERVGGHAMACGFTIKKERLPELRESLDAVFSKWRADHPEDWKRRVEPEVELKPEYIDGSFFEQQRMLAPFGKQNEKPVVGLEVYPQYCSRVGKEGQFLKFSGRLADGRQIRGIDFKRADEHERVIENAALGHAPFPAVGNIDEQEWNGNKYMEINLLSIGSEEA
ncbi:MAG: single-stranded-DNA-specific exonuclease RecJ [Eubacterium sp.]|jgi:single-stranded-DNA-specific exonuclease